MRARADRDLIARVVKEHKPETVGRLASIVQAESAFDEDTFLETVKGMARDGSLKLRGASVPYPLLPRLLVHPGCFFMVLVDDGDRSTRCGPSPAADWLSPS